MGSKRTRTHHANGLVTKGTRRVEAREPTFAERTAPLDDPRGPLGVRLAAQHQGDRLLPSAGRASLVVPLDSSVVVAHVDAAKHVVDRASFLFVGRGARVTLVTKSPVAHVLILSVGDALKSTLMRTYPEEIDAPSLDRYLGATQLLPRTVWVNEIAHRYLFERAVCTKRDNDATRFLETELLKEVYFLCRARATERDRASLVEEAPLVQRARRAIEARLFEGDVVAGLARACGASASTLLRAFQQELGQSPLAYVRARRLDESLLLLKSRRFSVGEVAAKVGYRSFAAFSQAFRARFGESPSDIRGQRLARE